MMMRFSESPRKTPARHDAARLREQGDGTAAFKVGDTQIMASDGHCAGKPSFQGFALTINAANDAEADKLFNAVGKGRAGPGAARQDLLRLEVRHGDRQVRRAVDGAFGGVLVFCIVSHDVR